MSWYRQQRRDEQVKDYRAKRKQKNLLTAAGVLGVAGGAARAPWAAKHAVRAAGKVSPGVGARLARVPGRARVAGVERRATAASTPLAIASGATGSLSSLTYAGRLKRETTKEGKKLGIEKSFKRDLAVGLASGTAGGVVANQLPQTSGAWARRKRRRKGASVPVEKARSGQPPLSDLARRRARDSGDDTWRGSVSPGAQAAHDAVLPPYKRRYQRQGAVGAGTAALGVGAAGVGGGVALRNIIRASKAKGRLGPIAAGTALAGGGVGAAGLGVREVARGVQGAHGIEERRRAIRGRGHQRGLDAVR